MEYSLPARPKKKKKRRKKDIVLSTVDKILKLESLLSSVGEEPAFNNWTLHCPLQDNTVCLKKRILCLLSRRQYLCTHTHKHLWLGRGLCRKGWDGVGALGIGG